MNLNEILAFFDKSDKLLLTTHESPDGDGLGAEYALCSALLGIGKTVRILNSDPSPERFVFYDQKKLIQFFDNNSGYPEDLEDWTLVILDTEPTNIGHIGETLRRRCKDILVVDHHSPKSNQQYQGWLLEDSSSTCEMVFHILKTMHCVFKPDIAAALYTGLVYDTGSFAYPNTKAQTFQIAETLVSSGAEPNQIFIQLYENKSKEALILRSMVNSTLLLCEDNRVAIQVMSRETLLAVGATYDESQEIVNIPLQCGNVRVSVFLKEDQHRIRRCSIRSKGEVDCAAIAQSFGGGGHKTAAGFGFDATFSEIQEQVLEAVRASFHNTRI